MNDEIALPGGQCTPGVVRIGDTVRRPLSEGWEFRHALLRHLENAGFPYAPRLLGIDEQEREILTFLDGVTMQGGEVPLADIGAMMAAFHAATAGSDLAAGHEVVCHQDIAPWNTIHRNGTLVGMIDFDGAAPGDRIDDIAYATWTFLNIGSSDTNAVTIGLLEYFDGYGPFNRAGLSDAILRQQQRVLSWRQHLTATATDPALLDMSRERTVLIPRQMEWVRTHQALLDADR